jgi:uncharacterized membrane protein YoaK (UPF0700 family)
MSTYLLDAWQTVVPPRDSKHGPLPPLLVLLTVVTGLVDAFSYLALGHVFVANMTGNVVFLAFALAGASGFLAWASVLAIAAFAGGAFIGGRITHRHLAHRGRMMRVAALVQLLVTTAAFIVALACDTPYGTGPAIVLISLLGVGMGLQNATARALGVPDLTTTVLTLTVTGISADSRAAGGQNSRAGRRLLSVLSMFLGALIGAALIGAGLDAWVLLAAVVLLAIVAAAGIRASRSDKPWVSPS